MLRLISAIADPKVQHDPADLTLILNRLADNITKSDEKSSHRMAYAITSAVLFMLIEQSVVRSFNILGIDVSKIGTVKAFIPPITMYFALATVILQAGRRQNEEILEAISRRKFE